MRPSDGKPAQPGEGEKVWNAARRLLTKPGPSRKLPLAWHVGRLGIALISPALALAVAYFGRDDFKDYVPPQLVKENESGLPVTSARDVSLVEQLSLRVSALEDALAKTRAIAEQEAQFAQPATVGHRREDSATGAAPTSPSSEQTSNRADGEPTGHQRTEASLTKQQQTAAPAVDIRR